MLLSDACCENKQVCVEWLITMTCISTFCASKYSRASAAVWVGAKASHFPSLQHFLTSAWILLNLRVFEQLLQTPTQPPAPSCQGEQCSNLQPALKREVSAFAFLVKDAQNLQSARIKPPHVPQRGRFFPLSPPPLPQSPPFTAWSWRERKINTA